MLHVFYAYSYWVGAKFILEGRINEAKHEIYKAGDIATITLSLVVGMMSLMSLSPNLQQMSKSLVVGKKVFEVIDREPEIKDHSKCSNEYQLKKGIKFENITFNYPTALEGSKNIL